MRIAPVHVRSRLDAYEAQVDALLDAWRSGDPDAVRLVHENHPRFLDPKIPWLPLRLSDGAIRAAPLDPDAARLVIARWYNFLDWPSLQAYVDSVAIDESPTCLFETAVEAVIEGDVGSLRVLIERAPDLVRARSARITNFDPPRHRATLLHYVAANGVENYRQRSPQNAVAVATVLLDAGAEVDAPADMYGGQARTMSMLVSSTPPAVAGVQVPLVETLADYGAAVNPVGDGAWTSPLLTALAFGFRDAADALVRRGARVDTVAAAAGLGRVDAVRALLPASSADDRHRALAFAAQAGHADVVGLLLDEGQDPNRYNPAGAHAHATPLHHAALGNHDAVVRLLVERGARLDIKDTIYHATPLGWALHGGHAATAEYLRAHGAA